MPTFKTAEKPCKNYHEFLEAILLGENEVDTLVCFDGADGSKIGYIFADLCNTIAQLGYRISHADNGPHLGLDHQGNEIGNERHCKVRITLQKLNP